MRLDQAARSIFLTEFVQNRSSLAISQSRDVFDEVSEDELISINPTG
jgi:hypothetical protein